MPAARRERPAGAPGGPPHFLLFGLCDSAEPAADFESFEVRLSRSTRDAALPAFFPVVSPPLLFVAMIVLHMPASAGVSSLPPQTVISVTTIGDS